MAIDEQLVEWLLEAEEWRQQGRDVTPEALCPDRPDLWPALGELLHGLDCVDRVLADPSIGASTEPGTGGESAEVWPQIPDFALIRRLGRGGMGIVFEAVQESLGRRVAIKVLPPGAMADPQNLRRFEREARAAARLHHTNIVPVFGVGRHEGVHYYVMQFIEGRGLDAVLDELRRGLSPSWEPPPDLGATEVRLSPGEIARSLITGRFAAGVDVAPADGTAPITATNGGPAMAAGAPARPPRGVNRELARGAARIGVQVAEALAYAHEQGILHRDIKPSNLLLDADGHVWVADFGLAKPVGADDLTRTGDVVGTLRYLAPERFRGGDDARADIYALGLTLYELLALRPAFEASDRAELIRQITQDEPPRLHALARRVPRDLETIVQKAIAREPNRRYASAAELADDLRRFLEDRPIRARRVGAWERSVRWCRRNPLAAGLLAGLVVVFLSGFAVVTVLWRRADAAAARASKLAVAEAEARAAEKRLRVKAQAEIAARDFDRAVDLAERGDSDLGMLWMTEALRQAPPEEPALPRLIRANLAAWEGPSPRLRAILEHGGTVEQLAFRPDGRAVLTGSDDGTARLWDVATGRPLGPPLVLGTPVRSLAFTPDCCRVLVGGFDGKVRTWFPETGQPAGKTWVISGEPVWSVTFVAGGRLLMTYGRDLLLRFWDVASGKRDGPAIRAGGNLNEGWDLSPDGRLLVHIGEDGRPRFREVPSGQVCRSWSGPEGCTSVRLSPDGGLVAAGCADGTASVWDARTGRRRADLPRHSGPVQSIRFSPDGRHVATLSEGQTARISDTATGQPVGARIRSSENLKDLEFSPDGRLIATASVDGTGRLWDAATGRPAGPPLRHRRPVVLVDFSADGRLLLTASIDGTAQLWEIGEVQAGSVRTRQPGIAEAPDTVLTPPIPGIDFWNARFSPDRTRVLLWNDQGSVRVVDVQTGQPVGAPIPQRWPKIRQAVFSPDSTRFAIATHDVTYREGGSRDSTCQVWDSATGRPISPLLPHADYVAALSFRPDGGVLATGDYTGSVHFWDARTGARVGGPVRAGSLILSLAFSPDGRVLAVGTGEPAHQLELWDVATLSRQHEPIRCRGGVRFLDFTPDGIRLAAGTFDTTIRIIEVASGSATGATMRHDHDIHGQTLSPDGRSMLTVGWVGGGTGYARLWDVATGRPLAPAITHPGAATTRDGLAFSPDSQRVAIGFDDGTVGVWDAATARPIGPPRQLRGSARTVAFSRDGRSLLAVDGRGTVRSWPLPEPPDEPIDRLIGRLQVRTALEVDASGEAVLLELGTWHRSREKLGEPPSPSDPSVEAAWHEACARDAEAIGDIYAARWHLDRLILAHPDDGMLYARRARTWLPTDHRAQAQADMLRALELGPRDRIADWLCQRAADSLADGRPGDAIEMLDRAIAARPDTWIPHMIRAEALGRQGHAAEREIALGHVLARDPDIAFLVRLAAERARAGRWAEAVPLYDRAIALGTVPYEVWTEAALAHLEVGDESGYRRVCEVMRGRHPADIADPEVRMTLAGVLTLGPGGVGDDGKGLRWIEPLPSATGKARPQPWRYFPRVLDAVLLRAGRPAEAIERIRAEIALRGGAARFEETVFLAMAAFQTGDGRQARALLAALGDGAAVGPSSEAWWGSQVRRLLRREAVRLILDGDFPADPFAHDFSADPFAH